MVVDLSKKLEALEYLNHVKNREEHRIAICIFNDFLINVERLLWDGLVTGLAVVYEKNWREKKDGERVPRKEVRSLYWYLEEKRKEFPAKAEEFDAILTQVLACDGELNKVRKMRDKLIAHRDKNTMNENNFISRVELKLVDATRLLQVAKLAINIDIEKVDATPDFGVSKLFNFVKMMDSESQAFRKALTVYGCKQDRS
jgi:hypothetical protein